MTWQDVGFFFQDIVGSSISYQISLRCVVVRPNMFSLNSLLNTIYSDGSQWGRNCPCKLLADNGLHCNGSPLLWKHNMLFRPCHSDSITAGSDLPLKFPLRLRCPLVPPPLTEWLMTQTRRGSREWNVDRRSRKGQDVVLVYKPYPPNKCQ